VVVDQGAPHRHRAVWGSAVSGIAFAVSSGPWGRAPGVSRVTLEPRTPGRGRSGEDWGLWCVRTVRRWVHEPSIDASRIVSAVISILGISSTHLEYREREKRQGIAIHGLVARMWTPGCEDFRNGLWRDSGTAAQAERIPNKHSARSATALGS